MHCIFIQAILRTRLRFSSLKLYLQRTSCLHTGYVTPTITCKGKLSTVISIKNIHSFSVDKEICKINCTSNEALTYIKAHTYSKGIMQDTHENTAMIKNLYFLFAPVSQFHVEELGWPI